MEKILFQGNEEEIAFYVLDSTRLAGRSFLLVTDVENGDGDCYILEDLSRDGSPEALYEIVEEEELLDHLANIFGEQSEDFDIEY